MGPMPVITRYQIPREGLQASSAFADAIIAKYTASEGVDLPSAAFVYPENASDAAEAMDRLSAQLITLNRIRVQMNVYNQRWLHQFALSLHSSCRMLLRQLNISGSAFPGSVSQASVRELEHVLRELGENKTETTQEETILRILTAASRGNGARERYMSRLYMRLQESGKGAGESRQELLYRAGTELLLLKDPGSASGSVGNGWALEAARQFFWRVQRAPEQERKLLLQASGYGTIVSLERALQSMNSTQFRRFSIALVERMGQVSELSGVSESLRTNKRFAGIEEQIEQISPAEWTALTELLEKEGYFFTDDEIVTLSGEDIPALASEQARQLFWRIQRAPEQERQFFLEAGGFSSMEALGKALKTMDDVTFRRFSAQVLEKLHAFAGKPEQAAAVSAQAQNLSTSQTQGAFAAQIPGGTADAEDADAALIKSLDALLTQDSDAEDRIQTQKQVFLKHIHGGSETARVLERALRTVTEQHQILTENTQIYELLSESVLNMTMSDWRNFRTEIMNVRELELPGGVDFSFLQTPSDAMTAGTSTPDNEKADMTLLQNGRAAGRGISAQERTDEGRREKAAQQLRIEEGIRMSREKTQLIRELRVLSRMPDSSIRTVERFLRENTLLRESAPAKEGASYYQKLTAKDRENWRTFIANLLSAPGGSGAASIPAEQVFYRIHTRPGGAMLALLQGDGSGRDREVSGSSAGGVALSVVERLREGRVVTGGQPAQQPATRTGNSGTFSYLLQRTAAADARGAAGDRVDSVSGGPNMELASADLEVPYKAQTPEPVTNGPDMELAPADLEVPHKAQTPETVPTTPHRAGSEEHSASSYRDIEFETTSYHTQEHTVHEAATELGDVVKRLDQQQREIERLRSTQQRLAEHNVSREILKKLDERVQMERLRGGR